MIERDELFVGRCLFFFSIEDGMKVETIVGVVHIGIILLSALFFLFPASKYDLLYLIWTYSLFVSWTVFDGHCILTYSVRHPGDTKGDSMDIYRLFPSDKEPYVRAIKTASGWVAALSILIVLRRSHFHLLMAVPLFIYQIYQMFFKIHIVELMFFCIFVIQIAIIVQRIRKVF
jgi:hypothetical protein